MSVGPSVRRSVRRSAGPSVGPSHFTFFSAKWLIETRARDLWRSALFLINPPQRAELLRGNYGLVLAGGTKHRYDSGGTYIPTLGLDDSPPALLPNARPPPIDRERETTPFLHRLVLTYV